jgi:hypothetical protein
MWTIIAWSLICDVTIACMLFYLHWKNADRTAAVERITSAEISKFVNESANTHDRMMKQAKEGTIWLLRDDLLKTIDFYEATLKITQKQYKRIKDEYEYYTSIGGNHDVKDRFDSFFIKIYGTGEIKMVPDDVEKLH